MSGLRGHLQLTCALDARGESHLRRQSFRAPMHISKPHLEAETLVVNIINPTAGLLSGDEIQCDITVESGGRLLLINKIELAPYVGADLGVMARDAKIMRGEKPFLFADLRSGQGKDDLLAWLRREVLFV